MIVRIIIAVFASLVAGLGYLSGLGRLVTGLLLGFSALSCLLFGVLFSLPVDGDRLLFPLYEKVPAWPYFLLALLMTVLTITLFVAKNRPACFEQVESRHFKYLLWGIGGYLISLFGSAFYWFPSDEKRLAGSPDNLSMEVLAGTVFFLVGISVSCYCFYRASRGCNENNPDLMRRFVLAFFAFFQFDKVPLLVAYLLIYSPETEVIFPHIAALALVSYLPVGIFLLKTTWDIRSGVE